MNTNFNLIDEINCSTIQCNVKVRVIRLWSIPDRFNANNLFSIDMVLQDAKGDRIYAKVGKSVIRTFKGKISELCVYHMKNLLVEPSKERLKTTDHKFMLTFTQRTTVEETNDPQFDLSIFRFRPYEHLINAVDINNDELFDVIGQIVTYSAVNSCKQGENTSVFMNVEMQDDEGKTISATFWGEFVDQILPYLNGSCDEPVVVVMQLIKAHKFQEKYSVRNTWYTSKLWINSELPQVTDFKSRMLSVRGDNSIGITQICSQSNSSVSDELASGHLEVKKICDVLQCQHEESFWILATIIHLDLEFGWSYLACKKCTKKVDKIGSQFKCKKCDRMDPLVTHRYRIPVRATDKSGRMKLLLWNTEATKLIGGKLAHELKEEFIKTPQFDYPLEIDALLERKVLFKVLVKSSNVNKKDELYTVLKICDDEDVLKKYDESPRESPSNDSDFNNGSVMDGKQITHSITDNGMISPSKTPAKRSRCDNKSSVVEVDDDINAQLSSNRLKRVIKKEKK